MKILTHFCGLAMGLQLVHAGSPMLRRREPTYTLINSNTTIANPQDSDSSTRDEVQRPLLEYVSVDEFLGTESLSYSMSMSMSFSFPMTNGDFSTSSSNSEANSQYDNQQQPSSKVSTSLFKGVPKTQENQPPSSNVDYPIDYDRERSPEKNSIMNSSGRTKNIVIILLSMVIVVLAVWLALVSFSNTEASRRLSPAAQSLLLATHRQDRRSVNHQQQEDEEDDVVCGDTSETLGRGIN